MKLASLAAAVAVAAGLVPVDDACACSCVPIDAERALGSADGAFIGRLVDIRETQRGAIWSTADPTVYVFAVDAVARGEVPRRIEIVSAADGASCGIETPIGSEIGLFIERDGGVWRSSLCSQVDAADLERAATDAGITLTPPAEDGWTNYGPERAAADASRTIALGAAAALLAAVLVALALRRRSRRG